MRIRIVDQVIEGGADVEFDSPLGRGRGRWQGVTTDHPNTPEFDVELYCDDDLTWGEQIRVLAANEPPSLSVDADGIRLVGRFHSLDDDVVTIDLGGPSLTVGTWGEPPTQIADATIEMRISILDLFPYQL